MTIIKYKLSSLKDKIESEVKKAIKPIKVGVNKVIKKKK